MRAWLVTIGEPVPTERQPRLYRTGILAEKLRSLGHDVTWWTSTFDHFRRQQRHEQETRTQIAERYRLIELHGMAYRRSVSVARLINHYQLARAFAKAIEREPTPSIILSSLPTVELCEVATRYGARHGVPVVLDMRDMWPDMFADLFPAWLRPAARVALTPLATAAHRTCAEATAITGITEPFVDWGLGYARRARGPLDRSFPHGYSATAPSPQKLAEARGYWRARGVGTEAGQFVVCFFGTIGRQLDLDTVLRAAIRTEELGKRFKFVLCGNGDDLEKCRQIASKHPSIDLPGWVDRAQIWSLMEMSAIGLAPYWTVTWYEKSYPNKTIEYLCGGIPCAYSLRGLVHELLTHNDCGIAYENGRSDALADSLIALAEDQPRLARMKENARRVFAERFEADKVYGEMASYLEEVVATGPRDLLRRTNKAIEAAVSASRPDDGS